MGEPIENVDEFLAGQNARKDNKFCDRDAKSQDFVRGYDAQILRDEMMKDMEIVNKYWGKK